MGASSEASPPFFLEKPMLQILSKRSSCADKRPDPANLANGELAINFNSTSSNVFYKNNCGCLNVVGAASVSAIAPNSCATGYCGNSPGEFWFDSTSSALKIWNGSSWFGISSGTSSGTVTAITAGSGLTGGTITTSGTIALATTAVTAGTYPYACVTVDCFGRITSASCGATPVICVTGSGAISVDNLNPSQPVVSVATASTSALGVTQLVNSISSTSTTCAATPASVKCAYDLANAALPKAGGTMTGDITFNLGQIFPVSGIQCAGLGTVGVVQLSNSVSCTSNSLAATPNAVKCSYDLANAALPKTGGTMIGNITFYVGQPIPIGGIQLATTSQCGVVQIGDNINVAGGTISVNTATTLQKGVVQLNNTTSSTCTDLAATAASVKSAYDLANSALPKSGGTMTGALCAQDVYIAAGCALIFPASCQITTITNCCQCSSSSIAASASAVCTTYQAIATKLSLSGGTMTGALTTAATGIFFSNGTSLTSITDATDCNCSNVAASAASMNATYAVANAALPRSGGTMTGNITFNGAQTFPVSGIQDATTSQKGLVQVGTNISVASGTISVASASTSVPGIVQLNDTTTSTSITEALTAAQGKSLQDQIDALAVVSNITLGGTFDANTGFVDSVTAQGTTAGLVVGNALPAPGVGNEEIFVIVDVQGTNGPNSPTLAHVGDWFLSDGTTWQFLNVGFAPGQATTSSQGVVQLATNAEVQAGTDTSNAVVSSALQSKISDSISTTSCTTIASSTAVKCAYDLANTALPGSTYSSKGALVAGTGVGTYSALAVGANDYILAADSACSTGLKWVVNTASGPALPNIAGTVFGLTCNCEGNNVSLGLNALRCFQAINGSVGNTAIGWQSMYTICAGRYNSALGKDSLGGIVNGCSNIGIGFQAGCLYTCETGNVVIGGYTGAGATGINCNVFLADGCGNVRVRLNECGALGTGGVVDYGCSGYVLTSQGGTCPWTWSPAAATGVTCVTAGSGLCGGPITTTGSICLDTNCVFGPVNYTSNGALIVGYGTGVACVLDVGTAGQILTVDVACTVRMKWATPAFISCTAYTAKGDLLSASAASTPSALPVGTNSQVLTACSTCTTGLTWSTITQCTGTVTSVAAGTGLSGTTITGAGTLCLDTACVIQPTILTAKGSLISASAASTPTALAVGTDGQVLTACAACTSGLTWAAGGGGGSGTVTSITAGTGLTGGTITTSGTVALDTACVVQPTAYTAKGTLLTASAASTPVALPVGTDGQVLAACSSCTGGLAWTALPDQTPVGTIAFFAMSTAPTGWTVADGSCVSRTTFSALFAAIGTTYGAGNGSTTFQLPDMRGRFARGWNSSASGIDPSRTFGSCQCWATERICGTLLCIAETFGVNGASAATSPLYRASNLPQATLTPTSSDTSDAGTMGFDTCRINAERFGGVETRPANIAMLPCIKTGNSNALGVDATPTVAGAVLGCTNNLCFNTLLGCNAGACVTGVTACTTAIGSCALYNATGLGNTAIGQNAGCSITTGTKNLAIGHSVAVASATASCQLAIGFSATENWLTGDSCKNIRPGAGILSTAGTLGTNGQALIACANGCGVCWGTIADSTPVGSVAFFAMSTAPTGWLVSDGSCISRTTYSQLFSAIGTTYGAGDGSTTFQLPDLRGRFVRGCNSAATGCDPNRVFGSCQTNGVGPHNHTLCAAPGSSSDASSQGWTPTSGTFATLRTTDRSALPGDSRITSAACNVAMACAGCCIGSETRPDNIAMLPCIKAGNSAALGVDATPTVAGAVLGCTNNLIHNTTLGCNAGAAITATTCCMTAIGKNALNLATGNNNTAIGMNAGCTLTTGANNTLIGFNAAPSAITVSNEITLGNSSITAIRAQVTSITSLSDGRDKTHIRDIPVGLDFLNSIRPVEFKWNMRDGAKVGVTDTGFIAQDLQEVQEEIGYTLPGLVYEENPDRLEAAYGKLLPVLVKAIQELSEKNAELERRIKKLEG